MTSQEIKFILQRDKKIVGNYVYYPIELIDLITGTESKNEIDINAFLSKIGISKNVFYSDVKRTNITDVRHVVCKVLRQNGHTFTDIGKKIGRDYSSVIHLIDSYRPYNEKLVNEYFKILNNG